VLLNELFSTVNWVLQSFARDRQWRLEGELGVLAMLHTWTQRMEEHFHVHCIVPGGVCRYRSSCVPLDRRVVYHGRLTGSLGPLAAA
jgi:hypothetical protein